MSIRQAPVRDRALDALLALMIRQGLRKTTMADVAREARCSRAILYQRFGGRDGLLRALFAREYAGFLAELADAAAGHADASVLEAIFVRALRFMRDHPAFRALIEMDRETLASLAATDGRDLAEVRLETLTPAFESLMDSGVIRRTDPRLVAEVFLRVLLTYIFFGPYTRKPTESEDDATARAVREVLVRGLLPVAPS